MTSATWVIIMGRNGPILGHNLWSTCNLIGLTNNMLRYMLHWLMLENLSFDLFIIKFVKFICYFITMRKHSIDFSETKIVSNCSYNSSLISNYCSYQYYNPKILAISFCLENYNQISREFSKIKKSKAWN